ncbi:MAG TPA: glycosyltransferase [Casimicrobiaceae bacterium]|nr:glycosyltransferase [Casimicrobiaceae bacterium]
MPPSRATLVMTARERHSLADAAIDGVLRATARPYRFLYLDVKSPPWLRARLAARAAAGELEVVPFDTPLWPQEARLRVAADIDTDYTVFLDNDVDVAPGWLDALVRCADETGAGIVGPLYLWGDGVKPPTIHMAGGVLCETADGTHRVLEERHELQDADAAAAAALTRRPCDYVEFHCMLVRTSLLRGDSILDGRLRCVHEHIDASLTAKERGSATVFEPAARVTYLALADYRLDDLAFFRSRWTSAETEANIATFCRKWNVVDDARSFAGVRTFIIKHLGQVDLLHPTCRAARDAPMPLEALCQTRSALLDAAARIGYRPDELEFIARAYHIAHMLADAGYRPCGRPFINHLVGTASVLVHYGLRAEAVAAGLLHAAYTHSPPHSGGSRAALTLVREMLGGRGHAIESRVRAYTRASANGVSMRSAGGDVGAMSLPEAEVAVVDAANELDMHLSGEFRYSKRSDMMTADAFHRVVEVCALLELPGLHASLARARDDRTDVAPTLVTSMPMSYRISRDRGGAVAMAVNELSALSAPDF